MRFALPCLAATMMLAAVALLPAVVPASDAAFREAARAHTEKVDRAVVTIEVVAETRYSFGGRQSESEERTQSFGTVIDERGLVVTALSSVDQGQFYSRLQPSGSDDSFVTTVRSIKYIFPDGEEVPATVVLRDMDLDLIFLRPLETPEEPMVYVDLNNHAEPDLMERVYSVARMGRIARRTVLGMSGEIQGIVRRPRPFYISSGEIVSAGTGVPVFNAEGQIIGIVNLQTLPGGFAARSADDEIVIPVIRPTLDILEIIDQVPDDATAGETLPGDDDIEDEDVIEDEEGMGVEELME